MNPTPLTVQQIDAFDANGFVHGGRVLSDEQVSSLNAALSRVVEGQSADKPDALRDIGNIIQIVNIWEAEPAFKSHLYNRQIVQNIAQLMHTDTVRVWHDQIQIKPAHTGGPTLWHQDFPYWPVIQPGDLISAWVALADADEANGCMSMVPGSHKWGAYNGGTIGTNPETYEPAPADPDFIPKDADYRVVPCPVRAGHVLYHHCLTWHGAPANKSARPRPAIAVHYMPGYTRYIKSNAEHLVEKHITVASGDTLIGEHFPTVLDGGKLVKS